MVKDAKAAELLPTIAPSGEEGRAKGRLARWARRTCTGRTWRRRRRTLRRARRRLPTSGRPWVVPIVDDAGTVQLRHEHRGVGVEIHTTPLVQRLGLVRGCDGNASFSCAASEACAQPPRLRGRLGHADFRRPLEPLPRRRHLPPRRGHRVRRRVGPGFEEAGASSTPSSTSRKTTPTTSPAMAGEVFQLQGLRWDQRQRWKRAPHQGPKHPRVPVRRRAVDVG